MAFRIVIPVGSMRHDLALKKQKGGYTCAPNKVNHAIAEEESHKWGCCQPPVVFPAEINRETHCH
jgi:hypothetical protein